MPNKATREAKVLCNALIDDPEYQRNFKARLDAGELAPPLEAMVWYYAHGKPTETVSLTATRSLARILAGDFEPEAAE